jgi:hypothetical protein
MSNIKPMLRNAKFVKKQTVELIIQSVRRSIRYNITCNSFMQFKLSLHAVLAAFLFFIFRGGSQVFNKRAGTFRMNENIKENGHISMPPAGTNTAPASTSTNR